MAWDGAGEVLWFGTDAGLARYERGEWISLPEGPGTPGPIWDLEVDGEGGLWAATSRGLLHFAGETWTTFTPANSGLEGELVFTLAIPPLGERVYVGTDVGVSAYDRGRGTWSALLSQDQEIGSGVGALLIDDPGHLWVGTLGRGLGRWDGEAWDWFRAGGPALPFNTVTALFEREPGVLWVGTSQAASAGGAVSTFDGEAWQTFEPQNSGYWGAEPLVIVGVPDLIGRGDAVLIGTRAFGIAVYQPR
jgi:ligand-binding sensor domain-containing protein